MHCKEKCKEKPIIPVEVLRNLIPVVTFISLVKSFETDENREAKFSFSFSIDQEILKKKKKKEKLIAIQLKGNVYYKFSYNFTANAYDNENKSRQ